MVLGVDGGKEAEGAEKARGRGSGSGGTEGEAAEGPGGQGGAESETEDGAGGADVEGPDPRSSGLLAVGGCQGATAEGAEHE